MENSEKAQEDAQKALQLDPYNVKALLAKAESLFASGKFELGKKIDNKIYVLLGDGECNEGSVWEAAMCASHLNLSQLTVIIDRNNFQQTGKSDEIMSYKNLEKIWNSFGFLTYEVNGHNIDELINVFKIKDNTKPKAIIANTIKGKGLSFAENDNNWHHAILTTKFFEKAMELSLIHI